MPRENDKSRIRRLVTYATREFQVAIEEMLEKKQVLHSFRLTDGPPAWDIVIAVVPTPVVDLFEKKIADEAAAFLAAAGKLDGPVN